MQNANDALLLLIDYLEKAQSRGAYTLREAAEITKAIDYLAQPVSQTIPIQNQQKSQSFSNAGLENESDA